MKNIVVRLLSACILLLVLVTALPAGSVQARVQQPALPAGLYQAFLQAASRPLSLQSGSINALAGGLTVHPVQSGVQVQGLNWNIALRGFGRGQQVEAVQAPQAIQSGDRLEYQRGALTEWYRDTSLGLEQGFTIPQAPKGEGQLSLQLDLNTDLKGALSQDATGLAFTEPGGQTLRYDNLRASAADGKQLEAQMTYSPTRVGIQVDDSGAAYPITVDPLIYLQDKTIAVDGAAGDFFGFSAALSGGIALVGAYDASVAGHAGQGAAYVFVRSGTTWSFQQKLTASDGAASDEFGTAVALSKETALVGAFNANVGGHSHQGAAYVYIRSGTTWSFQQKLTAPDGAAGDFFGKAVAISGSTALVGALSAAVSGHAQQGVAYVFVRSGTTWGFQQKLTAPDGAANNHFGNSVALSGESALVGAYSATEIGHAGQGAAYVFTRSGTTWSFQRKLTDPSGAAGDNFGWSAGLSGDTALLGAYHAAVSGHTQQGAAYVFTRSGTTWSLQQKLTASDGAASDNFGWSVALSGDSALVGAANASVSSNAGQGAAYLFVRSSTTWSFQQKLTASDGAAGDSFGISAALSGDTALVGAYNGNVGGNLHQGAAYFFEAYRTDADLGVSAAINPAQASPGDTVYLTASVTNFGPSAASYILQQASLPSGLTYLSSAATQGSYDPSTGSWSVDSLDQGIGATLTIRATVNPIPSQTLIFSSYVLSLDTNLANNSASASLQVLSPVFSASPTSYSFGMVKAGTTSPAKIFTIKNSGKGNLSLGSLSLAGTTPARFHITANTCSGATLAPNTTCSVSATFAPASIGPASAYIKIPDNAPGSPHKISLSGKGASDLALNGGFNTYPASSLIPTSWTAAHFSGTDGKDTATKQEGAASVRINGQASTTKTLTQTRTTSGSAGSSFIFSLYAKAASIPTSSGVVQAQVLLYNGSKLVQTKTITFPNGTYSFTQKSLAFTASGAYTRVVIKLTYSKARGKVWFDALSLLRAP